MALPVPPSKLVLAIVGAAHELTGHKRPPCYVAVNAVMARLDFGDIESGDIVKVDEAIQYALDHGLLRSDGSRPPHCIVVTADGISLIMKRK